MVSLKHTVIRDAKGDGLVGMYAGCDQKIINEMEDVTFENLPIADPPIWILFFLQNRHA